MTWQKSHHHKSYKMEDDIIVFSTKINNQFFFFSLCKRWKRHVQSQGHLLGMSNCKSSSSELKLVDYTSKALLCWMADNLGGRHSLNNTHYWRVKATQHLLLVLNKFHMCAGICHVKENNGPREGDSGFCHKQKYAFEIYANTTISFHFLFCALHIYYHTKSIIAIQSSWWSI